ncbi:unnamed protein product [Calypogeia fissa]
MRRKASQENGKGEGMATTDSRKEIEETNLAKEEQPAWLLSPPETPSGSSRAGQLWQKVKDAGIGGISCSARVLEGQ